MRKNILTMIAAATMAIIEPVSQGADRPRAVNSAPPAAAIVMVSSNQPTVRRSGRLPIVGGVMAERAQR